MSETFDGLSREAEGLRTQMQDIDRLAESAGNRLVTAFASAALHGRGLSDTMRGLALSLSRLALSQALRPLGNLLGGLAGNILPNAMGNVIAGGKVFPFAAGGIVNAPTLFPMQGGMGLMGEAGPEAILPLARGADGRLGVRGGGINVSVSIATPDVQGFERAQSQVAALIARAVSRGQRNL
jgi:phage-related minor tail protein